MKKNRIFKYLIVGFIIFCLFLKFTKSGILVNEGKTSYFGTSGGPIAKIDCTYFTGLTFQYSGFTYFPDIITGKASCPFFKDLS